MKKSNTIFYILAFIIWLGVAGFALYFHSQFIYEKGQVDYLKENQRIMIWRMDDSCFTQLKNNADGILRLQVGGK